MKIRGNNTLFFSIEVMSGILVFILTLTFGDYGLFGLILFFAGLIATWDMPDEREMVLLFKASALHTSFLAAIMAIIYFKFPGYNWFHGFISFGMLTRGIIGLLYFLKE
ncbi:MAG: hypothetical protein ISS80_03185 [Candidatus Cloacimonetes bacterium]|nr:hypothetical protein [Candidatus Cloacimonadota bacterium]